MKAVYSVVSILFTSEAILTHFNLTLFVPPSPEQPPVLNFPYIAPCRPPNIRKSKIILLSLKIHIF